MAKRLMLGKKVLPLSFPRYVPAWKKALSADCFKVSGRRYHLFLLLTIRSCFRCRFDLSLWMNALGGSILLTSLFEFADEEPLGVFRPDPHTVLNHCVQLLPEDGSAGLLSVAMDFFHLKI